MAVTIVSKSYYPRKPMVVCTAASLSELADYVGVWAEGSEATISATKYVLDRTKGWVEEGGGSGGSELPAVTSDDNGDVLTVVEGAWGKAAPFGDVFEIPLTPVEGGGATTTVTYAQLKAAWDAGKRVYVPLIGAYIVSLSESGHIANAFLYDQGFINILSLLRDIDEDSPLIVDVASYDLSSL